MSDDDYVDSTAIELHSTPQQLAVIPTVKAAELVERLSVIREAMQTAMVEGVDYGHIPGTDKPALFKPGAEKLGVLFQFDVQLVNEKSWGPGDHLTVESRATVFHAPTGQRLGFGEGLATTREKKHATRSAQRVCPDCGQPAIIKGKAEYGGGWVCFKKKGGCGAKWPDGELIIESQAVGEMENPDLPDLWNTVVKMAEKRARVDAVLAVTGASALFTQDIADDPADGPVGPREPVSGISSAEVEDSTLERRTAAPDPVRPPVDPVQDPKLKEAAAGLKWTAIKDCYVVAQLEPPTAARLAFTGLDEVQSEALEAALRNRRFHDAMPTDVPYGLDEIRKHHGDTTDDDPFLPEQPIPLEFGDAEIDSELDPADVEEARQRAFGENA